MIFPVILSGGSGSRLWPLSREFFPKQLLALASEYSLLQDTAKRLEGLADSADPLVVCNEEHRFLVAEQFRKIGQSLTDIILEPIGRNTAPALTLAALTLIDSNDDATMLVMPADHLIQKPAIFHDIIKQGLELSDAGKLVTFGIVPMSPETGYGYIKKGNDYRVEAFVEKPDIKTAEGYLKSGDYLWNSGMFLMKASVWLEEIRKYQPDIIAKCKAAIDSGSRDNDFYRVENDAFASCPSNSIDYAVMENTDKAAVVPMDAGWSDIGAWSSLWEVLQQDAEGNVLQGDAKVHDTTGSLLISQHRLVAAVGLENIIIVETPDAVLVMNKDRSQDVKEIVSQLKSEDRAECQVHCRVYRPWGDYQGIDVGDRFQVKRITVNPGASLSLQMHHHRAEHWVVVKGTAKVTNGEEIFMLSENQSTYIPVGVKHRLENPGTIPLEIIEVQSGSYLGEDDIVRFDDIYNREND